MEKKKTNCKESTCFQFNAKDLLVKSSCSLFVFLTHFAISTLFKVNYRKPIFL